MPPRISARHASLLTASILAAAGCSQQHPGDDDGPDAAATADAPAASDAGVMLALDAPEALDAPAATDVAEPYDADLDAYYYPDGVRG